MFATIYSTLANTIRNVGRAQDGSEVIDWFVDSRANVTSDIPKPPLLSLPFMHWIKTTRALAGIAGAVAGLAVLLVYLGTKEEKAVPSRNQQPPEPSSINLPISINVQEVRAVETRQLPQSPEGINVAISATVEKNGERVQCEAELLGNQHIIHQKYIHYWGYKTETALILPEGKARNEIWAYFAVPDDQYMKNAEFRFDCNKLSTTWLPISLRRGAAPPT